VEDHPELLDGGPSDGDLAALALAGALLEEEYREGHHAPRIAPSGGNGMSAWRAAGWPWQSGDL
jgi:hypothetical protein